MMQWDKPDGPEDWLARFTVALVLTAAIAIPIVGVVMFWLLDAPSWLLIAATAVIAACLLLVSLLPEFDYEAAVEADEQRDKTRWVVAPRPEGAWGWTKRVGSILLTWTGLGIVINRVILEWIFGLGDTTLTIVAIALLPLAILVETFDLEDVEKPETTDSPQPSSAASP